MSSMEDKREPMKAKLHIWSADQEVTRARVRSSEQNLEHSKPTLRENDRLCI